MIGDNLANKIPCSDVNPISYISPVNSAFSFAEISLESVLKTLKSINPNKATGSDNIPNKILKMAAEIFSPKMILATIDLYQLSLELPKFLAGLFMTSFTPIYHPIN